MVRVWVGVFLLVPANVAFFFPNWVSALPTPVVVLTLLPVWCWSWRMRSNKKKIVNLGSKHRDSCQRKRRNKNNLYWYFKNDFNSLSSLSYYNSISCLLLFAFDPITLIRLPWYPLIRLLTPLLYMTKVGAWVLSVTHAWKVGAWVGSVTHVLGRCMHECQVSPMHKRYLHLWIKYVKMCFE